MYFLQAANLTGISPVLFLGTLGMLTLAIAVVGFVIYHQRRIIRYNMRLKKMEEEKQQVLLDASIRFQEEERNRLAADLHDDAGPLLATARLYLNENLINQEKTEQRKSIFTVKQIIDDAIVVIRNISHNLMPPTLKNFGLESATGDLFKKLNDSGKLTATSQFHDYSIRLKMEQELLIFRIIQELINNIIKYSKSSFIHLIQNVNENNMYFRMRHDGTGIIQADFDTLNHSTQGLGLKNIASRIRVLKGKIFFEKDSENNYYKITIEIPRET